MGDFRERNINPENQENSLDTLNTQLKEAVAEQKRLPKSTNARLRVLMLQEKIKKIQKKYE